MIAMQPAGENGDFPRRFGLEGPVANEPNPLIVIAGGGHAKVVVSLVKKLGLIVGGYTDPVDKGEVLGAPYLGSDDVLGKFFRSPSLSAAIGLGKTDSSPRRRALAHLAQGYGFLLPVLISPHATVNEQVILGKGSVVFDGGILNAGTIAGDLCIINTNAVIEHDCRLGDNVHVATAATLAGGVRVGSDSLIGVGAVVLPEVTVAEGCIVGAGAVVTRDLTVPGIYVGSPARRIA